MSESTNRVGPSHNHRSFRSPRFSIVLIAMVAASPWMVSGAIKALEGSANSPLDWVDRDFAPRAEYDHFSEHFGAADAVVISWPGCTLDNPKIDNFVTFLRQSPHFFNDSKWLFHRVVSGREVYTQLVSPPLSVSRDQAASRLAGSMLGRDGKTTSVLIAFDKDGLSQRSRLVPLIRAAAMKYGGAEYSSQHLAGPVIDGYSVDRASQLTMKRFVPLSSIIVFCVCILCLGSLYASILVFGVACISQVITLAVLHYSGGEMTALLIVLPPLIQVLAIAAGIHFINYYLDARRQSDPDAALKAAFRVGWWPCVLSSTTTAIGLGSLSVSGLVAVREFGIYSALGVITTVVVLLVVLPATLALRSLKRTASQVAMPRTDHWRHLLKWQQKRAGVICVVAIVAMVCLGAGVMRLQASVRIETLFGKGSRLIDDYAWLEENMGALVPIETVVSFERSCQLDSGQRLELLGQVQSHLHRQPDVAAVTPGFNFDLQVPSFLGKQLDDQYLSEVGRAAQAAGFSVADESGRQWRFTSHFNALGGQDYGQLVRHMKHSLQQSTTIGGMGTAAMNGVTVRQSGLMPLVHEIQSQLLRDLFTSFLTAFAIIAVIMTIIHKSLWGGLLTMVPNVFPALTLFGLLGWLGFPIDIGTMMTASVAMGIAVDDTIHFLAFFRRRIENGDDREQAVLAAFQRCGRAMIQTTLICGAGLAIFALSDFVPTARFAWMMVALLTAALVGDLLVLPAILLSPLGLCFTGGHDKAVLHGTMDAPKDAASGGSRQQNAISVEDRQALPRTIGLITVSPPRMRQQSLDSTDCRFPTASATGNDGPS